MTEQQNKEKEYLLTVSQYMLPNENPFAIRVEEDKELFVISPANTAFLNDLDTISRYKTLFDTVSDLTFKISFSLRNAIETAYSSDVLNEFDLLELPYTIDVVFFNKIEKQELINSIQTEGVDL